MRLANISVFHFIDIKYDKLKIQINCYYNLINGKGCTNLQTAASIEDIGTIRECS